MICLRPSDVSEWGAWPMPKEQETFRLPSRSIVECFSALFAGCRSRDHPSEPPTHRHHQRRRIQWIRPLPFSSRTEYFDPTPHVQRPQRVRRVVGENCPRAERLIGLRDYCLGSRWSWFRSRDRCFLHVSPSPWPSFLVASRSDSFTRPARLPTPAGRVLHPPVRCHRFETSGRSRPQPTTQLVAAHSARVCPDHPQPIARLDYRYLKLWCNGVSCFPLIGPGEAGNCCDNLVAKVTPLVNLFQDLVVEHAAVSRSLRPTLR